ncbi:PIR Superfamily Protein [Plasmodium ovale wallikeri]|uniref:PIR Superfamily Protein n=1 Tax=Plasmodium ovale wallikeri TaxID=864142 RepID=A0A1A9AMJ6_PLAOA|nr:PIR Superfamily Protein [Plasmodium ovale wallikeri]SBT57629.1 PIR Superfamily Protein [Plasmodium ovale wallikeri]
MATEPYEQELPANKYANELNRENSLEMYYGSATFTSVMTSGGEKLKKIAAMLHKNYAGLHMYLQDRYDRCDDLNYWLEEHKDNHKIEEPVDHHNSWSLIDQLWHKLQYQIYPNNKCNRENINRPIEERKKRKNLQHFCENRKHLRSMCKKAKDGNFQNDDNCKNLSKYVEKSYTRFKEENECMPNRSEGTDYFLHIQDSCSLYDMPKTFPSYTFETNVITENLINRTPIKNCKEDNIFPSNSCPRVGAVPETEVSGGSSNYLGIFLYIGLSFLAIFFILFYFTSVKSLLHKCKGRQKLSRRFFEDDGEELLEAPSQSLNISSLDKRYNLGYEP